MRKLIRIFLLLAVMFCILPLGGCSPSYPKLEVTIIEGEPMSQEHMLVYEIPIDLERDKVIEEHIKPSLEVLVNQKNMVNIPSMSYSKGEFVKLEFPDEPDKLRIEEFWIKVDKDTGEYLNVGKEVTVHGDFSRYHNPYYTSVDRVQGMLLSSASPVLLLPIHRGMVVTAEFGERRVQYVFVFVSGEL